MILNFNIERNYQDSRGVLWYNNVFDVPSVKCIYISENVDTIFIRFWQGDKFDQRWFTAVAGKFKIFLIRIEDWKKPSRELEKITFQYLIKMQMFYIFLKNIYVVFKR